jgi:hypothetical protein
MSIACPQRNAGPATPRIEEHSVVPRKLFPLVYIISELTATSALPGCFLPIGDGFCDVHGVVRDSKGNPVQDAVVSLSPAPESGLHVRPDVRYTGHDGTFVVVLHYSRIDNYAFILRVVKAGFAVVEKRVNDVNDPVMSNEGTSITLSALPKTRHAKGE